ncbi:sn-glycerol-3-phosphate transporter [Pseudomonas gingeri]|uniref:sn-glycerol-3-phosphate transporter n=1 Tax=Pseudomonas gingeri TaxID=117681 RepID=A0A7Y7YFE5_9PSED|nr:sn-glycerol-3-phosphate transporter [Pseudomonas gingeri]NWA04243.1 sn-glycerol-3-phosphate transporter [Pseudomonas gingeri]NWA15182.1 sn-glycerol-3-phosphate transporter [Pseudomonas gingeri]NWA54623.1 sn-glycerol-3-phosphate transporter [Pseudomonas gingeri]NWA98380.1 sn-glycerol-3-phosphate transporter [Pseudomonas gingeri]NWB04106.1 sn-glycerol-3-phosphate transporter [Pseudomonas gingeri]
MNTSTTLKVLVLLLGSTGLAQAAQEAAQEKGFWYAQTSLYTRHYSPDPEHNNRQDLIGLERHEASGWVYGAATFRNSFSQRSYYGYVGQRFDSSRYPLYAKVTGGLLQGYRGEYRDKIPLNRLGVAPVIIPSVGAHYGPLATELVFLGFNAAMITTGVRF